MRKTDRSLATNVVYCPLFLFFLIIHAILLWFWLNLVKGEPKNQKNPCIVSLGIKHLERSHTLLLYLAKKMGNGCKHGNEVYEAKTVLKIDIWYNLNSVRQAFLEFL